jgi:hypothetical protein
MFVPHQPTDAYGWLAAMRSECAPLLLGIWRNISLQPIERSELN